MCASYYACLELDDLSEWFCLFSRVHATPQPALSVGWSVGRLVGWSVGWSVTLTCFFNFISWTSLLLPTLSSDLKYGPCPPARDFCSRVSGLIYLFCGFWPHCSCPNALVISYTAPAHMNATGLPVYPASLKVFYANQFLRSQVPTIPPKDKYFYWFVFTLKDWQLRN